MSDDEKPSFADTLQAQMILEMISDGVTGVEACQTVGLPNSTLYYHIAKDEKFRDAMEAARAAGYDVRAENTLRVARGAEGHSTGDVKRDMLICRQENHMLSKWHPRKYGEKLQVEQKSATVTIPMTDDPVEAQRAYEELMKGP